MRPTVEPSRHQRHITYTATPRAHKASALAVAACFGVASIAHANPTNPVVVNGAAQFTSTGNLLTVTNTPNAIINWGSFSIGANEITRFVQQSASSAVLNRVMGQNPSSILGSLQSNGRVFVINPNGIVFGAGSQVNVAGLVASSLNLSNADFLAGRLNFSNGLGNGVINNGNITTERGGSVLMIGNAVTNNGIITSPKGEVMLAAGNSVELLNPGTPDLRVQIVAPDNKAVNLGQIAAEAGRIGIYAGLIQQGGTINANSVVVGESGQIMLKATRNTTREAGSTTTANGPAGGNITIQSGDTTMVSGTVQAKGSEAHGGSIKVLGNLVGLDGKASLDASGATGGGTVLVGGDFQGGNPEVQNAFRTYVGPDVTIKADAINTGDGGKVVVWADDVTRFYGNISAQGGSQSGNGGNVEVSGHNYLDFNGSVGTKAPNGDAGTLLLDPSDITISTAGNSNITGSPNFTGSGAGSILNVGVLTGLLNGGTAVTINASGGSGAAFLPDGIGPAPGFVTINTPLTYNSAQTLSFQILGDNRTGPGTSGTVNINQPVTNTGTGALIVTGVGISSPSNQAALNIKADVTLNNGAGSISLGGTPVTTFLYNSPTIKAQLVGNGFGLRVTPNANVTITGNVNNFADLNVGDGFAGGGGNAKLTINGNLTGRTAAANSIFVGDSAFGYTNSSLTVTGTVSVVSLLRIHESTVDLQSGVTLPNGAGQSGGGLTKSGTTASLTGGAIAVNGGAFTWSGGTIGGTGALTVAAGIPVTLSNNLTLNRTWTWANGTNFSYVGGTNITGTGAFNNTGTININNGTLSLGVGGTDTGSYLMVAGNTLAFTGGTRSFSGAGTVKPITPGVGLGTLNISGTANVGGSGTINVDALNWTGGTITNTNLPLTVNNLTTINVSGQAVTLNNASNDFNTVTVTNAAATQIRDTNALALGAITTTGDFSAQSGTGKALTVGGAINAGTNAVTLTSGADINGTGLITGER